MEVAAPIVDAVHRDRLDTILQEDLARPDLWELGADGTYYQRPQPAPRDPAASETEEGDRRPILIPDT